MRIHHVLFIVVALLAGVAVATARNWGFRVDYRLVMVDNNSDAVPFFARSKQRLGHRLYAGMLHIIRH
jgi:hypothetical protein